MAGQINRGSLLGEVIFKLSLLREFVNYVEIGTWNGQGSTKCFMDGLLQRGDAACLWTLESNRKFFRLAQLYWLLHLLGHRFWRVASRQQKLKLIYGRLVEPDELPSPEEIRQSYGFSPQHFDLWYRSDLDCYQRAPNAMEILPPYIDVLLFDGGEYSTYSEFVKLRSRASVVLLDDTMTSKCHRVMLELKQDSQWHTVLDLPTERNGIYIGCKTKHYALVKEAVSFL